MKITCSQADFRHCNVEKSTVERGQGGKTTIRVEGWSVELESVHARHLVVELPDAETEARGEAPTARGWPMGDGASVADAGVANLSPVDCGGLERPEQAAVIPLRDHRSCGSGELPESPTKGGPSCLD